MKKIFAFLTALSISASMAVSVFAQTPSVYLDGTKLEFDAEPFIENDRTLVPMRVIFEAVGANVQWDQTTKTAMAVRSHEGEKKVITLQIDNPTAFINSTPTELDTPAKVVSDRTFVPLRFVSEALGADVEWDEDNMSVIITTNK